VLRTSDHAQAEAPPKREVLARRPARMGAIGKREYPFLPKNWLEEERRSIARIWAGGARSNTTCPPTAHLLPPQRLYAKQPSTVSRRASNRSSKVVVSRSGVIAAGCQDRAAEQCIDSTARRGMWNRPVRAIVAPCGEVGRRGSVARDAGARKREARLPCVMKAD